MPQRASLAALDAQSPPPPPLDSVDEIRARMPAPWEVADARQWADRIRHELGWPTTTAPDTAQPPTPAPETDAAG